MSGIRTTLRERYACRTWDKGCGAAPGEFCKAKSGNDTQPHAARWNAYFRQTASDAARAKAAERQAERSPLAAALPRPEWVMVGVPRPDGSKRLYATREIRRATFETIVAGAEAGWELRAEHMTNMLIIDRDSYGQCLEHLMRIWANAEAEARGLPAGSSRALDVLSYAPHSGAPQDYAPAQLQLDSGQPFEPDREYKPGESFTITKDQMSELPYRPDCKPGCVRLDGHDGRDEGACMEAER